MISAYQTLVFNDLCLQKLANEIKVQSIDEKLFKVQSIGEKLIKYIFYTNIHPLQGPSATQGGELLYGVV